MWCIWGGQGSTVHVLFSDRVWDVDKLSSSALKVMPHPTFVYTAQYHIRVNKVVVTGGYDKIIRVWSLQTDDSAAYVSKTLILGRDVNELRFKLTFSFLLCHLCGKIGLMRSKGLITISL